MKHTFATIVLATALLLSAGTAMAKQKSAKNFDYYVLSLSWSPEYCAEKGSQKKDPQCDAGRRFAFVLHGLWPQDAQGGWPQFCITPAPAVPDAIVQQMLPIEPSESLIRHEWAKHGTCSGLSVEQYFDAATTAYRSVKIPAAYQQPTGYVTTNVPKLTADFAAANTALGLTANNFVAVCSGNYLSEVRVCLAKDLKPTKCGPDVEDQCGRSVTLRPTR